MPRLAAAGGIRGRRQNAALDQAGSISRLPTLRAGGSPETILEGYAWLEPEDIRACLVYAHRVVAHERVEPPVVDTAV